MRNILYLLLVVFIQAGYSQQYDNAADYYNAISKQINGIAQKSVNYSVLSANSDNENEVRASRIDLIKQINLSKKNIEDISPYKGSSKLKNEVLDVLSIYKDAFITDYENASKLKQGSSESFEAMEAYLKNLEKAENKLGRASEQMPKAQRQFAEKHNLMLQSETDLSQKMKSISAVNQYSRHLFLIYFKVGKQNSYYVEALQNKDAKNMEKNRHELRLQSDGAIKELKKIGAFEKDKKYLAATNDLVKHYFDLATGDYVTLKDIMENHTSLTQKDVDTFTKVVNKANANQQDLIEKYQKANKEFLRKHI